MPLEELSVKRDSREESAFVVSHRGEETKLKSGSAKQCRDWMQAIERARAELLKAKEER